MRSGAASAAFAHRGACALGDDTTVPIREGQGRHRSRYVRDDRLFGGASPPEALFYASRDRSRDHPERHLKQFTGILQADAYAGYNRLYLSDRKPAPVTEALSQAWLADVLARIADRRWPGFWPHGRDSRVKIAAFAVGAAKPATGFLRHNGCPVPRSARAAQESHVDARMPCEHRTPGQ